MVSLGALSPTVPLGRQFSLAAQKANREFSKRMSDSVKRFTEHSGLDELAHHDNVKFLFLIERSMWACPWSLRAPVRGSEYLGMVTDDYSTVPAWLSRDEMLLASGQAHL